MNPVKYDVLQRKKEIIARELKILREIQKRRKSDKRDEILEHALLHAMQNCISAIIDIAQHIVSEKSGRAPESYSDAIRELGVLGVLEQKFAEEFCRVAKLRNVLVHLYDNVDTDFLFSLVPTLIKDTQSFVRQLDKAQL
jgi:uncharacterized protein YutE (UPF0331/DUF86 family)